MRKNTQSGFSLVELMVVVAIIGILATVAIPRVNRFIAKSRQVEAQTNLASIHTSNKAFFNEFQGYTSSFAAMGYQPEGQLRYNVGWAPGNGDGPTNYETLKATTYNTQSSTKEVCPTTTGSACLTLNGADNAVPSDLAQTIATPFSSFTAGATALLISGGSGADTWTITESRVLTNTNDGTQ